jgi:hypothetical protein
MQQLVPWLIAAAGLAVLSTLSIQALVRHLRRPPPGPPPLPVEWDLSPRPVFTADERRVYRQLREALPHHIVLAKLPLVRFCQPNDAKAVRFWFDLLGASHVTFAVCSANGRVLAAIDLSYDRGGPPSRSTRIKQSVLASCRVRYLRCPADHMPSIPELQLLVPQNSNASRGPQPAQSSASMPGSQATAAASRRPERSTLWQDSMAFSDSFFTSERAFNETGAGELRPMSGFGDLAGPETAGAAMVPNEPVAPAVRH